MLNLAVLLDDSAREVPERVALIHGETRLLYAALQAAANQVANGLIQAGIRKGDTVAISCQNIPSFVIAYYDILKAGAAVLPLNVLLKPREIAYHLTDGNAKAYFCQEGSAELPIGQMGFATFQKVEWCQHSSTADMVFPVAFLVSYLSQYMTLEPGDVILTGTPEGVIFGKEHSTWLRAGDEVVVEIQGLGRLMNVMQEESAGQR